MALLETLDGVAYRWSIPAPGLPDLVGHAVRDGAGFVIFDPPAAPGLVGEIQALGPTRAIVLTGAHHDRAAGALRARLGMPPLLAPEMDVDELEAGGLLVDEAFGPGPILGNWEAILIPEVRQFGREWAFFRAEDATLVLSDLAVFGLVDRLYPEAFGREMDPALLHPLIAPLAERSPERILAGHGEDVPRGGRTRLEALRGR